jgi:hypothetical protein
MIDTVYPPTTTAPLSSTDLARLHKARQALENPGLAVKLASAMGAPVEKLLDRLPNAASRIINDATGKALQTCLSVAVRTLRAPRGAAELSFTLDDNQTVTPVASAPTPENGGGKLSRRLHQLAVAATGAAGGAFGMMSLPIELPVTTTLMFRSICAIAAQHGEDIQSAEVQLQCLTVLAMGGPTKDDDDASYGYFMVRGAMAQQVAAATAELAARGAGGHSSALVTKLLHSVAARFSAQVSEQAAAKAVPVVGAVFGAAVNTVFISHFQEMANAHFTVRTLERRYGEQAVRLAYSYDA